MTKQTCANCWEVVYSGQTFFAENYGPYGYKLRSMLRRVTVQHF